MTNSLVEPSRRVWILSALKIENLVLSKVQVRKVPKFAIRIGEKTNQ